MGTYTIKEYINKINKILDELADSQAAFIGGRAVQEKMSQRIFVDGRNTAGSTRQYKSKYYKKKRAAKGYQTSRVNYVYSGELQSDFNNNLIKTGPGEWSITLRDNNTDKVGGLENTSGPIFKVSDKEQELFNEIVKKEILRILRA